MISKQIANSLSVRAFFNINGRMGRLEYLLIYLIIFGALSLFEIVIVHTTSTIFQFYFSERGLVHQPQQIWNWVSYPIHIMILLFPTIKRLQDINLSKWFVLLLFLAPLYSYTQLIEISFVDINESHGVVFSGISLFMYIFLLLKKGTVGSNKYGPEPLEINNSPNS